MALGCPTMRLESPRLRLVLTPAQAIAEVTAIRTALHKGILDEAGVRRQLHEHVWPGALPDALGWERPRHRYGSTFDTRWIYVDEWVRAAICHGVLDTLRGEPRKVPDEGDEIAAIYWGFYLTTLTLMRGE